MYTSCVIKTISEHLVDCGAVLRQVSLYVTYSEAYQRGTLTAIHHGPFRSLNSDATIDRNRSGVSMSSG